MQLKAILCVIILGGIILYHYIPELHKRLGELWRMHCCNHNTQAHMYVPIKTENDAVCTMSGFV